MNSTINGSAFRQMVCEAAYAVEQKKQELNDLNVFPVPDGDTGTNMSLTLNSAVKELSKSDAAALGRTAEITSMALLRGARGNSGVILSLLYRGIAKRLRDLDSADGQTFAEALREGVDTAYKAVMKPAEGTILTVSMKAALAALDAAAVTNDAQDALAAAADAAAKALPETTDQNPVLKKAGVVDAGGAGFVVMTAAMLRALRGELHAETAPIGGGTAEAASPAGEKSAFEAFETGDIRFGYCTEFIVEREGPKDPALLREFLNGIGDSLVLVDDDTMIKVHVHTNNPGRAIEEALTYGPLSTVKVENMRLQHTEKLAIAHGKPTAADVLHAAGGDLPAGAAPTPAPAAAPAPAPAAAPSAAFGFVSVAAGDGLRTIFSDLGVSAVVEGGQTMNPSTEDILEAVQAVPADTVFVLPNNKNIIMAANQVLPLTAKQVIVVPTRSVAQGISAMLAFDAGRSADENRQSMEEAAERVYTGQLTYAARDSSYDDRKIREGDYIGLLDGRLVSSDHKENDVLKRLARELSRLKGIGFVTLIYGEGVDEVRANEVRSLFEKELRDVEVAVVYGGQPVYYYIISAE